MVFNFHHLKVDYKNGDKWELAKPDIVKLKKLFNDWQTGMQEGGGWNANFWCNHDQPRAVSRFGDDKNYRERSAKMLATATHMPVSYTHLFISIFIIAHFMCVVNHLHMDFKGF